MMMGKTNRRNKGTSITEALIVLTLLIPLCALLPTLAKIAQVKMELSQTVRYLGWNEALTGAGGQNQDNNTVQIQERILKDTGVQIQTQQLNTHSEHQRHQWAVGQQRLLEFSDSPLEISRSTLSSEAQLGHQVIDLATDLASVLSDTSFNEGTHQTTQHRVQFQLNGFTLGNSQTCSNSQAEEEHLCLSLGHAIATGSTLAAKSRQDITNQVNSLKPFSTMAPLARNIARLAKATWIFEEGDALRHAPLHVNTEALPQDRLE